MRHPRIAIISILALAFLLPLDAVARTVTIIITGTVASGKDTTGVFGPPGADLAKKPFTLVFTFDDSKGKQDFPPCANSPVCISQITENEASSPGVAALQIGDSTPYAFGILFDGTAKSRAWKQIWPNTYEILFEVGDGSGRAAATIIDTVSRPPATTNPDWRSPFRDNQLSKTNTVVMNYPTVGFGIDNRATRAKASGVLTPSTICVGDASSGCSYNPLAIAANAGQSPSTAPTPQVSVPPPPPQEPPQAPTPIAQPVPPQPQTAPVMISMKQATITAKRQPASGSETFADNCVGGSRTWDPGTPEMPLTAALDFLKSRGLKLLVDQNKLWTPLDETFQAPTHPMHFGGILFPDAAEPQTTYHLILSRDGTLVIKETGSAHSFSPAGSYLYVHLNGSTTWSATQTINLKSENVTANDTVSFTADLKAQYMARSRWPGKTTTCTINARYSGQYTTVDTINFFEAAPKFDCSSFPSLPKLNDVVVYRLNESIKHTGVVTRIDCKIDQNGQPTAIITRIRSKWGDWGVYEHNPNDVPLEYGPWVVYHTPRGSNTLRTSEEHINIPLFPPEITHYLTDKDRTVEVFNPDQLWRDGQAPLAISDVIALINHKPWWANPDGTAPDAGGKPLYAQLTPVGPPSFTYDCHGYVFAKSLVVINDDRAEWVIQDNGYKYVPSFDTNGLHH